MHWEYCQFVIDVLCEMVLGRDESISEALTAPLVPYHVTIKEPLEVRIIIK